jgi:signal peptide peptidase SppA
MAKRYVQYGCRLDKLLRAVWLLDPATMQAWVDQVWHVVSTPEGIKQLRADAEAQEAEREANPWVMEQGVARINLSGPLTKYPTSMSVLFGGTSMLQVQDVLRKAVKDDKIKGIFLEFDSPGGTVDGTAELSSMIRKIAEKKPVAAHAQDVACSGALWLSTQAPRLTCGPTASVGSQGARCILWDTSGKYKGDKVEKKPVVIDTGKFKSIGAEGQEITEDQRAEMQRWVDDANAQFRQEVVTARKLTAEQVVDVSTARVYVGEGARKIGLVDEVCDTDTAFEQFVKSMDKGKNGPAASNKVTVAVTGTRKMLNEQGLARARQITGNPNLTVEQADEVLLDVAARQSQQISTYSGIMPVVMDEGTARMRAGILHDKIDLLHAKGKITSAQVQPLKDMFMKGDKPNMTMLCGNGPDGKPAYEQVFATLENNQPNGLLEDVSADQPAHRTEPGAGANGNKAGTQEISFERWNDLRAQAGVPMGSVEEWRSSVAAAKGGAMSGTVKVDGRELGVRGGLSSSGSTFVADDTIITG